MKVSQASPKSSSAALIAALSLCALSGDRSNLLDALELKVASIPPRILHDPSFWSSNFNLPSRGTTNNAFLMHAYLGDTPMAHNFRKLASQLLQQGADLLILITPPAQDKVQYLPDFSAEFLDKHVHLLPFSKNAASPWVRDYVGPIGLFGSTPCILDAPYIRENSEYFSERVTRTVPRILDEAPRLLANSLGLRVINLNINLDFGNAVPLGDNALVVNDDVFHFNSSVPREKVMAELAKFGRANIIIVPSLRRSFHESLTLFHSSQTFCAIGETAIVPKIPEQAFLQESPWSTLTDTNKYRLQAFAKALDDTASIITNKGYRTLRVPLHGNEVCRFGFETFYKGCQFSSPEGVFCRATQSENMALSPVTPVNVVQVRDPQGRLTVFVPFPTYEYTDTVVKKQGVFPNPYQKFEPEWRDEILAVYREAGADQVIFTNYSSYWNDNLAGQNECLTVEIPHEIWGKLP